MFTGIIQEIGIIRSIIKRDPWEIWCEAPVSIKTLKEGDSVAIDGVCLSVIKCDKNCFVANISKETLSRSTLLFAKIRDKVNIEQAVQLGDRLHGHIVQGHVDDKGKILKIAGSKECEIVIKPEHDPGSLIVDKGSITVNGVSLTVIKDNKPSIFKVSIIPQTLKQTTFANARVGDWVNLEYDIIGKYVVQHLKF
ncbi:riboflavin synthase [bacterium]|nr:riboflavin synthase [candidate division CSSED10-310 bacterium]